MKPSCRSMIMVGMLLILAPLLGGAAGGEHPPQAAKQVDTTASTIPLAPKDFALRGNLNDGESAYKIYCAMCHGLSGKGDGIAAPGLKTPPRDFTDHERMAKISDWEIYFTILNGGKKANFSDQMPAWGEALTEEEIGSVSMYVRKLSQITSK